MVFHSAVWHPVTDELACIESLVIQGCKIIDTKLDHLKLEIGNEQELPWIGLSYMLSCKNP